MSIMIKEIPKEERPRERLKELGVDKLSNEELLAITINSGHKDLSAKELSLKILKEINDLNNISYEKLVSIKGVGEAKACSILAAIELGKRLNTNIKTIKGLKITSPKVLYDYYLPKLKHLKQEHFIVIYINKKQEIITDKTLFIGSNNKSIVDPKEIFKYAYELNASYIICIHNHPSGNVLPSNDDLITTKVIKDASNLLNIPLIDHIIIGKNKYYSLNENNDM